MATVSPTGSIPGTASIALLPGQTCKVSSSGSSEGSIAETFADPSGGTSTLNTSADPLRRAQGRTLIIGPVNFSHTFGPYENGCTLAIICKRGTITYVPSNTALLTGYAGAQAVGLSPSGALVDSRGIAIQHANSAPGAPPAGQATASVWFPLNEATGTAVADNHGSLQGTVVGTGPQWTALGFTGNGTDDHIECNTANSNQPQYSSLIVASQEGYSGAMQHLADLASLSARGDMILISAVISHPATGLAADGMIAGFGLKADPAGKGGWGVGIRSGAAGKLRFWHTGQGGTFDQQDVSAQGVTGNANNNTRTAVCFAIAASYVRSDSFVADNATLEVYGAQLTLGVDGGRTQNNVGLVTPSRLLNGATAACGPNPSNPLTIGAWGNAKPFANRVGAGTIATGASGHLTLTTPQDLIYSLGRWMWIPATATTPALPEKLYWVVMSSTTVGTIYTNGPGSAAYNFSAGGSFGVSAANFVNFFAGGIRNLVLQRRPFNHGLVMQTCRELRRAPDAFPACLR